MEKDIKAVQWLNNNQLGYDIWNNKYRFNGESFDSWLDRVSGGDEELRKLIENRKFLFGGRTLASRGTGNGLSFSNCYSSGYAEDSLEGIMDLNKKLAMTYKSSGGQGVSLSMIRPKGSPVRGGMFKSDGIVPFMEIFNQTTASVSQGGSRKGALMMSLSIWHPEIETFISIKDGTNKITKANLSVEIDDKFMELVKNNVESYSYDIFGKTYTINPTELYNTIMKRAWSSAEPGVIFTNKFRNYNLMQLHDEYKIITSNPCGEQPLPEHGACNLASINLSEYVLNPYSKDAKFDWDGFMQDIYVYVRALDDVLEEGKNLHALKEQREMAKNYRNIGLGIMGYATALLEMGIAYGSHDARIFTTIMSQCMISTTVKASALLAKERGTFPKYDKKILGGDFFKNLDKETMGLVSRYGLRNCSLLSIAPSGSIGTMLGVSTGLEPYYSLKYTRKTESLHNSKDVYYTIEVEEAKKARKVFGDTPCVSAMDIDWRDRVHIQGIMQKFIDTAISSTVNVPRETTVEELRDLYLFAWENGLKGITIYREGSFEAILSSDGNNEIEEQEAKEEKQELKRGEIAPKPSTLIGERVEINHGCGKYTLHIYKDYTTGKVFDCWINSKTNGCISNVQNIAVTISLLLRAGVPLERISESISGTGACPSFMVGKAQGRCSAGKSCGTAILQALKDCEKKSIPTDIMKKEEFKVEPVLKKQTPIATDDNKKYICPECGKVLHPLGGCFSCECGFTKCE